MPIVKPLSNVTDINNHQLPFRYLYYDIWWSIKILLTAISIYKALLLKLCKYLYIS